MTLKSQPRGLCLVSSHHTKNLTKYFQLFYKQWKTKRSSTFDGLLLRCDGRLDGRSVCRENVPGKTRLKITMLGDFVCNCRVVFGQTRPMNSHLNMMRGVVSQIARTDVVNMIEDVGGRRKFIVGVESTVVFVCRLRGQIQRDQHGQQEDHQRVAPIVPKCQREQCQ